jgi:hypothetical protein
MFENKRHALICQMQAIQDACADRNFLTIEDLKTVAGYVRIFSDRMQRLVEKRLKVRSTLNKCGYPNTSGGGSAS